MRGKGVQAGISRGCKGCTSFGEQAGEIPGVQMVHRWERGEQGMAQEQKQPR